MKNYVQPLWSTGEWISLEPKVRKKGKKAKKPNWQWMKQRIDNALICMIYKEDTKKAMEAINANSDSEIWCTPSPVSINKLIIFFCHLVS